MVRELMHHLTQSNTPNERDNHTVPTPSGAGAAVMLAVIGFLTVAGTDASLIWALLILTIISFIDDINPLSPISRLCIHSICAVMIATTIPHGVFQGILPQVLEFLLIIALLIWFMNIYNFMDGIDEITAVQTAAICAGLLALSAMIPSLPQSIAVDSIIILSSIVGFWFFNRHPATIFLGDSGSIPLGAIIGWLLLLMASHGYWAVALILPAYYITDSSITLAKRIMAGKKIWHAHSEHAYQAVVRAGHPHSKATRMILLCNGVLIGLVFVATIMPSYALYAVIAAYAVCTILCLNFWTTAEVDKTEILAPNEGDNATHALS